jgi:hypothetical protein
VSACINPIQIGREVECNGKNKKKQLVERKGLVRLNGNG